MQNVFDASGGEIGSFEPGDVGFFRAFDIELRPLGIFETARAAADACLDAALSPSRVECDETAWFEAITADL